MKFRISWPAGIIIALSAFIIFILTFVYLSFTSKYSHNLTSEDYYNEELNYQQEIDQQNNGIELSENVTIEKVSKGLLISFPSEFDPSAISGTISFQRLSNLKLNFSLPIILKSKDVLIEDENLVPGRWDIKIEWNVNDKDYLLKEKISY